MYDSTADFESVVPAEVRGESMTQGLQRQGLHGLLRQEGQQARQLRGR